MERPDPLRRVVQILTEKGFAVVPIDAVGPEGALPASTLAEELRESMEASVGHWVLIRDAEEWVSYTEGFEGHGAWEVQRHMGMPPMYPCLVQTTETTGEGMAAHVFLPVHEDWESVASAGLLQWRPFRP